MEEKNKAIGKIKEAIARAIVFFDLLDYPLAGAEIWKYLFSEDVLPAESSLVDVLTALEGEVAEKRLATKNGFYFLPGREALADLRLESVNLAEEKYKTAIRAAKWLRFVPGVKLVAVCNSLAIGNVHETSDIDLFIITAAGRIWLTRLFVTGVMQVLGVRRHREKINDRVCLSFYLTEDNLDLQPIALEADPYLYYWLATLVPVYDDDCFSKFTEANAWLKKYLPNYLPIVPHKKRRVEDCTKARFKKKFHQLWFNAAPGDWLEKAARSLQLKKMSKNTGSLAKENDTRVIISDTMLKFHETDKREEYRDKWINKLNEILG